MSSHVNCDLYLYADDSALLVSGKDICEIEQKLQFNLENVSQWLINNKLSLHLGKTESILYGSRSKLNNERDMVIKVKDEFIKPQKSVKYLGAHLDQCLSGISMSENVMKKCNQCLKFLYRKAEFLQFKERLMICNALIQPVFDYGSNFWFRGLGKCVRSKLQICQNKTIRFILNSCSRQHIGTNEFHTVKWLSVEKRVDFRTLCNMHKIYYNKAPQYLCQSSLISFCHQHNTRYSNMSFFVPNVKSNGKISFNYSGIVLWNKLPGNIKLCEDVCKFKSMCKNHLLSQMVQVEKHDFVEY